MTTVHETAAPQWGVPTRRHPAGRPPDRGHGFAMVAAVLFGLVVYEGKSRTPARVLVAFPHQSDADEHAQHEHLDDYAVVPLAFLTVDPPPWPALRRPT